MLNAIAEEEKENIDYILFIDGDPGLSDSSPVFEAVTKAHDTLDIPVLQCFLSPTSAAKPLAKLRAAGRCYFDDEVNMARALGRVVNRPGVSSPVGELPGYDRVRLASLFETLTGTLKPYDAKDVLQAVGIRTPALAELTQMTDMEALDIPFPWAMKVVGPLHKSDVGGVKLGIETIEQARMAWDELMRIEGAYACLVQQMVQGMEVLIGANREEGYGHLVAFGLGGIYAEALKDVQFCLAPLSHEEAEKMVRSIRAFPLLKGVRGQPGMDIEMLADWLIRVALLVTDFPCIREMDLNPVKGFGPDLYAVDARVIVD